MCLRLARGGRKGHRGAITEICGRDAELAVLAGGIAASAGGAGRLLVVEGAAGIGKSALLTAALTVARERGMTVLRARGNPLDRDFSFGVARQAFAGVQSSREWSALCRGPAALAERALGPGDPPPAGTADAAYAATHGLHCLTAAVAARTPAVLCVDDVHWADVPSLRWLAGLARRIDELPLTLLLAVRTGEPVADPEVLGELLAGAVVTLGPLDSATTARLVCRRFPAATAAFADACHDASGGNPFLLTALLAHLTTAGGHTAATLGTIGPAEVARWLNRRLRRLPEGSAALARAQAVLGPAARLRDAADLAGLDHETAARCADALRAAGLSPASPMVTSALHDGLGEGERSVWHARAARLLAARDDDPERAAVHLLRAEPAGDAAAVAVLRAAAARATGRGAPETAAAYLTRALDEPSDDAAIRVDLALALAAVRRPGAIALAHQAVARIADPVARAEAALRCGRALAISAHGDAAIEVCRLALGDPAVPPGTRARLEAEIAAVAGADSRTRPLLGEWLGRCRDHPPPLPLWHAIEAIEGTFRCRPAASMLALVRPLLDDGVLAAETDSLLPTIAGLVLVANGDLGTARAMSEAVAAAAGPRGWLSTVAHGRFLRSLAVLPAGLVAEAAADARAAVDFKLTGSTPLAGLLFALCPLLDALYEADRTADAEALLAASVPGEPPPHALTGPMLLQSRARLRLARDRPTAAIADLRAAGERWAELGVRHPAFATWRAELVAPLLAAGDRAGAEAAAREQLALAEAVRAPGPLSTALRAAALVAPREERLSLLDTAVQVSAGTPARLAHAYALVDLGSALRRANHRDEARPPLRAALDLAAAGGAHRLAARATAELHAAGARPRRAATHGPAALTDAEQQVAGLAASGLTNREIAQRLLLSRRTVETHLAHAYHKLGIASRRDLAAALH